MASDNAVEHWPWEVNLDLGSTTLIEPMKASVEAQSGLFPLPSWWKDVLYNAHLDNHLDVWDGSHEYSSGLGTIRENGVMVKVTDEGRGIMKAGEPLPAKDIANLIVRGLIRGEGGMNPVGVKEPIDADTLEQALVISYGPEGKILAGLLKLQTVDGVERWVIDEKALSGLTKQEDGVFFVSYATIGVAKKVALGKTAEEVVLDETAEEVLDKTGAGEGAAAAIMVPSGGSSEPGVEATSSGESPLAGAGCLIGGMFLAAFFVSHVLRLGSRR